ncbi:MAG: peptidylprolyl isomerase [Bryobacteraceae bacterium]|nr:peptidylprolyl isomerase [Bryobacteraceae bacterium]
MRWQALAVLVALGFVACSPAPTVKTEEKKAVAPAVVPEVFRVQFQTTKGPFVLEVTRALAPKGADRFHRLVSDKFYDGARFYRVRPKFVVQWGISKEPKMNELWKQLRLQDDPVKQTNARGTIAFATDGPNTRTTEVFINLVDNPQLDARGFSPFGNVVEGMDAVDKFFFGYGEVQPKGTGVDPNKYMAEGDRYIERSFPNLDGIISAKVVAQ